MNVILCVDSRCGMMFHHRRQSKDRVLLERIATLCEGKPLYMNAYSYQMFRSLAIKNLTVDEAFLCHAGPDAYCFVEDRPLLPYEEQIESITLYHWNRHYPADLYFDLPLAGKWQLVSREEFKGSSHDKITQEVYRR